mmetsp:Transcript_7468/g.21238  ORF Transcript_7468/g.21238 Transcript_7468/m.21238 type:complete len:290 (-) Transcript_7468:239-1108(-)
MISMSALKLLSSRRALAIWIKCEMYRTLCPTCAFIISVATKPLTRVDHRIISSTLGALTPPFLAHAWLRNSHGLILRYSSASMTVSWRATSTGESCSRSMDPLMFGFITLGGFCRYTTSRALTSCPLSAFSSCALYLVTSFMPSYSLTLAMNAINLSRNSLSSIKSWIYVEIHVFTRLSTRTRTGICNFLTNVFLSSAERPFGSGSSHRCCRRSSRSSALVKDRYVNRNRAMYLGFGCASWVTRSTSFSSVAALITGTPFTDRPSSNRIFSSVSSSANGPDGMTNCRGV